MTEKAQDALPVVEQEPGKKPIPDVSGGSADAGSATTGPDVSSLVKELAEVKARLDKLPDDIDARFKSGKDKRFAKVDEIYEWAKKAGGDPKKIEDAVERQVLLERLEALEQPTGSGGAPGRATAEDIESKTAEFLNDLKDRSGIELTDEDLKTVWGGKRYTRFEEASADVERFAWKKAKQANVGAGAAATGGGKQVTQSDTDDELLEQYEKASKQPVGKAEELKRLREEAKKRGLLK
jgi:hypothetical protein